MGLMLDHYPQTSGTGCCEGNALELGTGGMRWMNDEYDDRPGWADVPAMPQATEDRGIGHRERARRTGKVGVPSMSFALDADRGREEAAGMSRLYDRIMRYGFKLPIWCAEVPAIECDRITRHLRNKLESAQVIVGDNVTQYLYAGTDQEYWDDRKDFPCIAPPFPNFFIESTAPTREVSRVYGTREWLPGETTMKAFGILFTTDVPPEIHAMGLQLQPSLKWIMQAIGFVENRDHIIGPIGSWLYGLNELGGVVNPPDMPTFIGSLASKAAAVRQDKSTMDTVSNFHPLIFSPLLTLSFLHCKNVKLITNDPPPKLNKAYQKRRGRPLVRYHTLEIEPMKQILRREGQSETLGLRKALHICRGHFKDYTERGLFGKYHGLYWWDSQVRGNLTEGAVVKDYAVKQPSTLTPA